ncbi:bacilysin biosynthesis oxidoreductase [Sporothrix brasiliensis 5110]|uniref:Bacilysin biosynthesis oxidoreductase n=1 Tax=Sporothrix brasiliensis 5110 TaxID=1398154 RepID=A0A0C2IW84_9PEZI|nr:bacilysin biosynthesis oxidoreductase [Sporothrix brasiliensis 5110]KIH89242.1 bacilysin biosynthesis oxidoreductase [Sporothrix brasiliensis 5110]
MTFGEFNPIREAVRQSPPLDTSAPYDTASMAGKTILITGGAAGFGAAFARRWASLGAHIAIGDVNDTAGEAIVAELRATTPGGKYHFYQHCDVTSWDSQAAFFKAAVEHSATGSIHVVVPNAGVADRDSPANQRGFENPAPLDAADERAGPRAPRMPVADINVTGVLYSVHLAMYWLPRNDGKDRAILFLSSIAGLLSLPGQALYTMSKHAVTGLFRALRGTSHVHNGLRVNMLCPYFAVTNILPTSGVAMLAGAGKTRVDDVVEAGTRFVADQSIAGRAVVIGPRMLLKEGGTSVGGTVDLVAAADGSITVAGEPAEGVGDARQAVWECYGHDYENCEVFVDRYVRLLNLLTLIRGWTGFFLDLLSVFWRGQPAPKMKQV